ncbi:MAG: trypsin-like peptidase domain-containing protein [Planctomycetota bacterium]|nr:trypsin-like peptidase domain-containing protein [Planctomycetota bacterium]
MKRTLIEVLSGAAVVAGMIMLHQQIGRLEVQQADVRALERMLGDAITSEEATREELGALREHLIARTEARMVSLEHRLQLATADSDQAKEIAGQLELAEHNVEVFRSQLSTDFEQTKALVDAYMSEVRAKEADAAMKLSEARGQIASLASTIYQDREELTRRMLHPTVQLNGDDTVGSGTIVFSGKNPQREDAVETYVLTSFHVVRNILSDTPTAHRDGFDVTVYLPSGKLLVRGDMIAHDADIDAALVKLDTSRKLPFVANVLPLAESHQVQVWDPVCAVGCPLGNDPVPSKGEVSSLQNELNGANYWMVNAPTYFGNSGGGIYHADTHQLIGVFSKIYTHGQSRPVVVPHLGLCTPVDLIYKWLAEHDLDHLLRSERVERVDLSGLAAASK